MSRKESDAEKLEVELVHVDADDASDRLRRAFKLLLNAADREPVKGADNEQVAPASGEGVRRVESTEDECGSAAGSDIG